jgi:hypothetical protein
MAYLLGRILNGQHSSISTVIYFSANMNVDVPGVSMPSQFWIDAIPPNREPISLEFRRALRTVWMSNYSQLVPGPLYEIEGTAGGGPLRAFSSRSEMQHNQRLYRTFASGFRPLATVGDTRR